MTLPGRNACRPVVGITWGSHFFLRLCSPFENNMASKKSVHLNDCFIEQRSRQQTNYTGAARTGLSETNPRFTVQDISPDQTNHLPDRPYTVFVSPRGRVLLSDIFTALKEAKINPADYWMPPKENIGRSGDHFS